MSKERVSVNFSLIEIEALIFSAIIGSNHIDDNELLTAIRSNALRRSISKLTDGEEKLLKIIHKSEE